MKGIEFREKVGTSHYLYLNLDGSHAHHGYFRWTTRFSIFMKFYKVVKISKKLESKCLLPKWETRESLYCLMSQYWVF